MADPTPVEVTNVVETKPAESANGEGVIPGKPTIKTVTETHRTEEVTGATSQLAPPAVVADDNARKYLAVVVLFQFLALVGFMVYMTVELGRAVDPAQMMILGAEIGFVTTVLNYYFGSSSGTTAAVTNGKH